MACTYTLYNTKGKVFENLSYDDLVDYYRNGNYRDISDILFSKESKADSVYTELMNIKKDFKDSQVRISEDKIDGEPNDSPDGVYTTQTFIDSGHFNILGKRPIVQLSDELYIQNITRVLVEEEGFSQEEALQKAQNTISNWKIINEDAKDLHTLLNSFNFRLNTQPFKFVDYLRDTKFANFANKIYTAIDGKGGLFSTMGGRAKFDDDLKLRFIQSINLLARINGIGEDIIGHIDNLVIDTDGALHIYNYKITSTPISEWKRIKEEKYKYLMALLKQILAYNGVDVTNVRLHIVPIKIDYSDDFSIIKDVTVYGDKPIDLPVGREFAPYENAAKHFIRSNIKLDPTRDDEVDNINMNLNHFFPERGVKLTGILLSAEEWIKSNYSKRATSKIKRVDAPDHTYEVYFNDEYTDPIKIKDSTEPIRNEELKEVVQKNIVKQNTANNLFLKNIADTIRSDRRKGWISLTHLHSGHPSFQSAMSFIGRSLSKYITSYTMINGKLEFEWNLIEDDALLNANILLFLNKSGLVDVVCLSDYNLKAETKFNKQNNIMGGYVTDTSRDLGNLLYFKANYANIEALRTMIILNEILPRLPKDCKLGDLRILSTYNGGTGEIFGLSYLNRELFLNCVSIVNKNVRNLNYANNFNSFQYVDPLTLVIEAYLNVIKPSSYVTDSERSSLQDLGFDNLENLLTREQKRTELLAIIRKIHRLDATFETASPSTIISIANGNDQFQKSLANLYIACLNAYCYYSGIQVANEYKISKLFEYGMTQNRVPNRTYQLITDLFTKTIDDIATTVQSEYTHIYRFTMNFYNATGFSDIRNTAIGDLARAFNNLYKRNENNEILMEFRNPYERDTLTPLNNSEETYLKKVLFELAKIRSKIYGFDFGFNINDINTDKYKEFVKANKDWYFNVPLERASSTTVRSRGIGSIMKRWSENAKRIIHNPKEYVDLMILKIGTPEEGELMERSFDALTLLNPYIIGDGYRDFESSRQQMLEKYNQGYFETNVENILAHYLEKYIQTREYNKTLITAKAVLLQLELLGNTVGSENRKGVDLTQKMIQDYVKLNVFNQSILEPESKRIMSFISPLRGFVSKAFLAGNFISAMRDTIESFMHNNIRAIIKYQTDITSKDLQKAYQMVIKSMFTSARDITLIDALCRNYRLSYFDVARISEGLTTSRTGLLNVENWSYATIKLPDFLNRMTLFVARCLKDGTWDAFSLDDGFNVKYDWKKDKRFSVYADSSKKGTKEYEDQQIAYYNAIRVYNEEHPDATITFSDDLPEAYSELQILWIRNVANSIQGAYDRSMKAKWENTILGLSFTMFGTWMNGLVSNYFTKPGVYSGGMFDNTQAKDVSGNLLFIEKETGNLVVEKEVNGKKVYTYEATGLQVEDTLDLKPYLKDTPQIIQGIVYTLKDCFIALKDGGTKRLKEEILSNSMQMANLRKLISDLLMCLVYFSVFKLALEPAYTNYKNKEMVDHPAVVNAFTEIMYKSSSRAFDSFMGPFTIVLFLGLNTNPPYYELGSKVTGDLFKVTFGKKHYTALMEDLFAPYRSFKDTFKAERKKEQ